MKRRKASMTLEAALILPLFLFVIMTVVSVVSYIELHMRIQTALHQVGIRMAKYAYAYERVSEGNEMLSSEIAGVVISTAYAGVELRDYLSEQYLERTDILGGKYGLSLLQSEMDTQDCIDLVVTYQICPAFLPEVLWNFQMGNRARVHKWTGYDNCINASEQDAEEQMVYLAETGTVYHLTRSCTHLTLSVTQVLYEQLEEKRNTDGECYYPCGLCGDMAAGGIVYITENGNRYHAQLDCRSIRRTVREVPISEVEGRRVCSRCGNE